MTSRSNRHRRARPLLGTIAEICIVGLGENESHTAIDAAFATIEEVQRRMSFHDPASTLSRINRSAAFEPVVIDEWTFEVLKLAADMHRTTNGCFDASVAPFLQAQGFLPGPDLHGLATRAGFADVQLLADRTIRFHRTGIRLDLGGIAKGFAVDKAVESLRAAGVAGGLVNAGGDLRAFGDEPCTISIRHPDAPGSTFTEVELKDGALATSARYFADRHVSGATFGPIFDPSSGGAASAVRSATVRASTAMVADALTKIVMLTGEAALPVLEHYRADAMFVAGNGEVKCSPGFHAALEFSS
jgi:thiamine biosynthesis lipoprotein